MILGSRMVVASRYFGPKHRQRGYSRAMPPRRIGMSKPENPCRGEELRSRSAAQTDREPVVRGREQRQQTAAAAGDSVSGSLQRQHLDDPVVIMPSSLPQDAAPAPGPLGAVADAVSRTRRRVKNWPPRRAAEVELIEIKEFTSFQPLRPGCQAWHPSGRSPLRSFRGRDCRALCAAPSHLREPRQ